MRKLTLLLAAATALGIPATAMAVPKLAVASKGTATTLTFTQRATDAQPASITAYAPSGYRLDASAPAGTLLGNASGQFFARDAGASATRVTGTVRTVAPSSQKNNSCAAGTHAAVWMLSLRGTSLALDVPVFVDPTSGDERTRGALKIVLCLGPSDVAPGTAGRSPGGAQLLRLSFTVRGPLTPPVGTALWKAITIPYAAGTGKPNTGAMVETRAFVGPGAVTAQARVVNARRRLAQISGVVTSAGQRLPFATVRILVNGRTRFTAVTDRTGHYSLTRKLPSRHASVRAKAVVGTRDVTSTGCSGGPLLRGVACVSATTNPFSALSRVLRLRFRF